MCRYPHVLIVCIYKEMCYINLFSEKAYLSVKKKKKIFHKSNLILIESKVWFLPDCVHLEEMFVILHHLHRWQGVKWSACTYFVESSDGLCKGKFLTSLRQTKECSWIAFSHNRVRETSGIHVLARTYFSYPFLSETVC